MISPSHSEATKIILSLFYNIETTIKQRIVAIWLQSNN